MARERGEGPDYLATKKREQDKPRRGGRRKGAADELPLISRPTGKAPYQEGGWGKGLAPITHPSVTRSAGVPRKGGRPPITRHPALS